MEIFAVIWGLCAVTAAVIANGKGRSGAGWFLLGLALGIFAVIMIACLPAVQQPAPPPPSRPRVHMRPEREGIAADVERASTALDRALAAERRREQSRPTSATALEQRRRRGSREIARRGSSWSRVLSMTPPRNPKDGPRR